MIKKFVMLLCGVVLGLLLNIWVTVGMPNDEGLPVAKQQRYDSPVVSRSRDGVVLHHSPETMSVTSEDATGDEHLPEPGDAGALEDKELFEALSDEGFADVYWNQYGDVIAKPIGVSEREYLLRIVDDPDFAVIEPMRQAMDRISASNVDADSPLNGGKFQLVAYADDSRLVSVCGKETGGSIESKRSLLDRIVSNVQRPESEFSEFQKGEIDRLISNYYDAYFRERARFFEVMRSSSQNIRIEGNVAGVVVKYSPDLHAHKIVIVRFGDDVEIDRLLSEIARCRNEFRATLEGVLSK